MIENKKLLIIICCLILATVIFSRNKNTSSDPHGTLVTAQSIIEYQSIKLDNYKNLEKYDYKIYNKNGHYYYFFPLGSSISSLPFVFIATQIFPFDMNEYFDESVLQVLITAFISVLIFLFLFKIANIYIDTRLSIILSAMFWFGTSLSSTSGTALWSHNFASLYAAIAIFLTITITKDDNFKWMMLGLVLFMAYLTRPTMSLLAISTILYLFFSQRKSISIKTALLAGLFLCLFAVFSLCEYNQVLPDYYMPKRLNSSDTFWTALYGNIFSPSRGLFIFSPFLLLIILNIDLFFSVLKRNKTLLIFLGWITLHLTAISKFPHWWAGFSFGPRLMTDILIPLYVLFIILFRELYENKSMLRHRINITILIITGMVSVYINTKQGLYNKYTAMWNSNPNIDQNPEYLFNWKYPQFLMNKNMYEARLKEFNRTTLVTDNKLPHNSPDIIYVSGWSGLEKNHVWSVGKSSQLELLLKRKQYKGILSIDAFYIGKQLIKISINDSYIGEVNMSGNRRLVLDFNSDLLIMDKINNIKFEYSNPHMPGNGDSRVLAMALQYLEIQ